MIKSNFVGYFVSLGLENLEAVNMKLSRNQFIVGFCLLVGFTVPKWAAQHPELLTSGKYSQNNAYNYYLPYYGMSACEL